MLSATEITCVGKPSLRGSWADKSTMVVETMSWHHRISNIVYGETRCMEPCSPVHRLVCMFWTLAIVRRLRSTAFGALDSVGHHVAGRPTLSPWFAGLPSNTKPFQLGQHSCDGLSRTRFLTHTNALGGRKMPCAERANAIAPAICHMCAIQLTCSEVFQALRAFAFQT